MMHYLSFHSQKFESVQYVWDAVEDLPALRKSVVEMLERLETED